LRSCRRTESWDLLPLLQHFLLCCMLYVLELLPVRTSGCRFSDYWLAIK